MGQLRDAMIQAREAFHREWSKGRPVGFFLLLGTAVVIANLLFMYERRSIRDAVIVVLLWIVVNPLIGYWRYSRKSR
jgi:hypothetical protein